MKYLSRYLVTGTATTLTARTTMTSLALFGLLTILLQVNFKMKANQKKNFSWKKKKKMRLSKNHLSLFSPLLLQYFPSVLYLLSEIPKMTQTDRKSVV